MKTFKAPFDVQMPSAGDPQMHVIVDVVLASDVARIEQERDRLREVVRMLVDNDLIANIDQSRQAGKDAVDNYLVAMKKALALLGDVGEKREDS